MRLTACKGQTAHANCSMRSLHTRDRQLLNEVTASCLTLLLPCRINHSREPAKRPSSIEGNEAVGWAAFSDKGQPCICTHDAWSSPGARSSICSLSLDRSRGPDIVSLLHLHCTALHLLMYADALAHSERVVANKLLSHSLAL